MFCDAMVTTNSGTARLPMVARLKAGVVGTRVGHVPAMEPGGRRVANSTSPVATRMAISIA